MFTLIILAIMSFSFLCLSPRFTAKNRITVTSDSDTIGSDSVTSVSVEPPAKHKVLDYPEVKVYIDRLLSGRGYEYDGAFCIPLNLAASEFGIQFDSVIDEDQMLWSDAPGVEIRHRPGEEYLTANGRYILLTSGYFIDDGELYLPCDVISRLFSISVESSPDERRAYISTAGAGIISGGDDYYSLHYTADDIYWLSHAITCESVDEPLTGKIGIGNVILNRVADKEYPSTIYEVLFDTKGGIQFGTAGSGNVFYEPDELSIIAAYMCLDGFNTVGDSKYYVNPETGDASWFDSSLEKVITIGRHNFYKDKVA